MGVLVKGVGISRVLVHECQGVGLCYDGGEIGEDARDCGDERKSEAELIEDVGGSAKDVA